MTPKPVSDETQDFSGNAGIRWFGSLIHVQGASDMVTSRHAPALHSKAWHSNPERIAPQLQWLRGTSTRLPDLKKDGATELLAPVEAYQLSSLSSSGPVWARKRSGPRYAFREKAFRRWLCMKMVEIVAKTKVTWHIGIAVSSMARHAAIPFLPVTLPMWQTRAPCHAAHTQKL